MTEPQRPRSMKRIAGVTALSVGLLAGGYGIASAASGSGTPSTTAPQGAYGAPGAGQHGPRGPRAGETALTGDTLAKVTAAAVAKVPGATVDRAETDADGNAKYEAHMTKADGSHVTVYVNEAFAAVSVETAPRGPHGGRGHGPRGPRAGETALTGDTLAKVTAAAVAKVPGATVDRAETDADGNAKYEAHMTKADGSHVTVYVNEAFAAVSVETAPAGRPGPPHG